MRQTLFLTSVILAGLIPAQAATLPTSQDQAETEIYRNQKYGFEVHYPKGFMVEDKFDDTGKYEYTNFKLAGVEGRIDILYNDPNQPYTNTTRNTIARPI